MWLKMLDMCDGADIYTWFVMKVNIGYGQNYIQCMVYTKTLPLRLAVDTK